MKITHKSQTPYVVPHPLTGGGGNISGRTLTPDAPLPEEWFYPVLVYYSLPANAVENGSEAGFWVVEFISPKTGIIHGRSDRKEMP